jgi:hypothetical protein
VSSNSGTSIVPRFVRSPRLRRRLFWIGLAVAAAGTAAGLILSIPSPKHENVNPTGNEGPADTVAQTNVRLTGADRQAIDDLLAKFVPAAVGRQSATTAWALAGPELKAASTLAQWKRGVSPVPAFPVRERTFTGWPTIDVEKNEVTLSLLVHPKPSASDLGDYTFAVQAIRSKGRWLINRLYTIAINHPVRNGKHELGPADFQAPSSYAQPPEAKPELGSSWLLPIVGILLIALVAPLVIGGTLFVRSRRRKRALVSEEMPSLPSSYRSK